MDLSRIAWAGTDRSHRSAGCNADANTNAIDDPNDHIDCFGNASANAHFDSHCHRYADTHAYIHTVTHPHRYTLTDRDRDGYPDSNGNPDTLITVGYKKSAIKITGHSKEFT